MIHRNILIICLLLIWVAAACTQPQDTIATDEPTQVAQVTVVATEPPRPTATNTAVPPTATDVPPTATSTTVPPTATTAPTDTPAPTATDEPTSAPEQAESVESTDEGSAADTDVMANITAITDAAMFAVPNPSADPDDRLGYFIPNSQTAAVIGISEDGRWLDVRHPLGFRGWVAASRFDITSSDLPDSLLDAAESLSTVEEPEYVPPTSSFPVRANKDAAIFVRANPAAEGDRTGYYIPYAEAAYALGISENRHWVHIANWGGIQGWVSINYIDFTADNDPWTLPLSQFSARGDVAEEQAPPASPTVQQVAPQPTQAAASVATAAPQEAVEAVSAAAPTSVPPTTVPVPTVAAVQQPSWSPSPTPVGVVVSNPNVQASNLPMSGAIAFWRTLNGAGGIVGDGTWVAEIQIRVPTSFQYSFQIDPLATVKKTVTNQNGDDYYVLRLGPAKCGQPLNSALTVVQNRASTMQIRNDDTFNEGNVYINPTC